MLLLSGWSLSRQQTTASGYWLSVSFARILANCFPYFASILLVCVSIVRVVSVCSCFLSPVVVTIGITINIQVLLLTLLLLLSSLSSFSYYCCCNYYYHYYLYYLCCYQCRFLTFVIVFFYLLSLFYFSVDIISVYVHEFPVPLSPRWFLFLSLLLTLFLSISVLSSLFRFSPSFLSYFLARTFLVLHSIITFIYISLRSWNS